MEENSYKSQDTVVLETPVEAIQDQKMKAPMFETTAKMALNRKVVSYKDAILGGDASNSSDSESSSEESSEGEEIEADGEEEDPVTKPKKKIEGPKSIVQLKNQARKSGSETPTAQTYGDEPQQPANGGVEGDGVAQSNLDLSTRQC
ncbi:hypothetical protein SESBI_41465 [Sesbania bispinosa]|nr:hypothetical protein SESBI_41465 [Sesbania bispinosa]